MYTDQRLYRARALEPIAGIGDVLLLLDQSGPLANSKYASPFFAIGGIEPVVGLTPHNYLILWSQGATAPAGYGLSVGATSLIPEVVTGNLNQSASIDITNPKILQQGPRQLLHCRFALKTTALTGIKEHDVELQVYNPAAAGKFGVLGASPGYFNMVDQVQDPGDVIDSPAQNANQTLPAAFPAIHQRDQANLSEMFIWELNGPRFRLWNNGSAAATAGTIGLRFWGFRYDLIPLGDDGSWKPRWVYGAVRNAPQSDKPPVVVPTAPFQSQGQY